MDQFAKGPQASYSKGPKSLTSPSVRLTVKQTWNGGQDGPAQGLGVGTVKDDPEKTLREGQVQGGIPRLHLRRGLPVMKATYDGTVTRRCFVMMNNGSISEPALRELQAQSPNSAIYCEAGRNPDQQGHHTEQVSTCQTLGTDFTVTVGTSQKQ